MKLSTFLILLVVVSRYFSQTLLPKSLNSYEDKELAIVIFDRVNSHRETVGQAQFAWSEKWYSSASAWNLELSKSSSYTHSKDTKVTLELIVSVTLVDGRLDYSMIADSCVQQWIHSPFHRGGLESPIYTEKRKTASVQFGGISLDTRLVKYGAISATVHDKGGYKIVVCVLQLGQYLAPFENFGK